MVGMRDLLDEVRPSYEKAKKAYKSYSITKDLSSEERLDCRVFLEKMRMLYVMYEAEKSSSYNSFVESLRNYELLDSSTY